MQKLASILVILFIFFSFPANGNESIQQLIQQCEENNDAVACYKVGKIYYKNGNYDKALEYYKKDLEITLKTLGENHPSTAASYNNIGLVYKKLGDYEKALEYYKKALEIKLKTLGENHPSTATTYNNIGLVYYSLGDYEKAIEYYKKALKIRLKTLGENHPDTATIYNNIAGVYDDLGDYEKAIEYYKKALEIILKTLGENHPSTATTYNNIGLVYTYLGDYEKALEYLKKDLEITLKTLGENHPDTATTYNNIGLVYTYLGDYEKAFKYITKAVDIFLAEKDRMLQILDDSQKDKYLKSRQHYIHYLLKIGYKLYTQKNNPDTAIQTFNRWINYKGSILDSEITLTAIYQQTDDNQLKNQIKQLMLAKRQLAKLYQSTPQDPKQLSKWKHQIQQLEEKIQQLKLQIAKKSEKFRQQLKLSKITYKDIANSLKDNQLYIDYAKTKDNYYIFALDSKGNLYFRKTPAKDIDHLVAKFRKMINAISENPQSQDFDQLTPKTKETLAQIYQKALAEPLGDIIKNKDRLIISPDGALRLIPFEALYDKAERKYLIQTKQITYIPAGKELVRLHSYKSQKTDKKAVVFANPDYDKGLQKKTKNTETDLPQIAQSRSILIKTLRSKDVEFKKLPWTEEEAKAIEKILKPQGYKVEKHTKDKATEEKLLKTTSTKILHIATHGVFIDDKNIKNPMLKALIALTGANKSVKEGDDYGLLTALKLSGMELKGTDLVVLSACETGMLDPNSTEGVSALAKAFILAGSRNVVMSLWQVSDKETKQLMEMFYRAYREKTPYPEALRQSKLQMIQKDLHPYFWASFIINGL